jgi:DNA-binding MarR family transcriptional regulator
MPAGSDNRRSIGRYITHIHMTSRSYLNREMEPMGIGSGQYYFLMVLYRMDGASQDKITERVMVDKATTTRAISKLETLGLVERRRDPSDRRKYIVSITKEGWDLRPRIREILNRWTESVLKGFETDERERLMDYLERLEINSEDLK